MAAVGLGLRRHHHAAAEIAAVRDRRGADIDDLVEALVRRDADGLRLVADRGGQRRPEKGKAAAEKFRDAGAVHGPVDRSRKAEARDVVEIARRLLAIVGNEGQAADVDLARRALRDAGNALVEIGGKAEGLAEIAAGAGVEDGEMRIGIDKLVLLEKAVHHLVDRAVAADRDHKLCAFLERLRGELGGGEIARRRSAGREMHADGAEIALERFLDDAPGAAGLSPARARVHDRRHMGHEGHQARASLVASACEAPFMPPSRTGACVSKRRSASAISFATALSSQPSSRAISSAILLTTGTPG